MYICQNASCVQLFREQVAQHVSSVTVSLETADQQLVDLYSAVTSSHEKLKTTNAAAEAATASADAASSAVEELTARLKKVRDSLWPSLLSRQVVNEPQQ